MSASQGLADAEYVMMTMMMIRFRCMRREDLPVRHCPVARDRRIYITLPGEETELR